MDDNTRMKQNCPTNILWRLFRIWVEETEVPLNIHKRIIEKIGAERNESK